MVKFVNKLLSSKIIFFLITTAVILSLNLIPLIMQARHSPAGRTFGLIHNNVQDYYFYQSLMNEGANGAWLTSDPYTSEPHQTSIIFSYFLWLGKLSKLFNLSYALTYHLSRIILGFLFLLSTFYFLLSIRIPYPRLTYLFFLFAAPFMHIINDYGTLRSVPFMSWWNGIDPIRRAAFLPHHMLGGLFLVLSIILIMKLINSSKFSEVILQNSKLKTQNSKPQLKTKNFKYFLLLILLAALMAFVHAPSLLILLIVLPSSVFIYYLINILRWESAKPKIPILKTVLNASIVRFFLGGDTAWQVQGKQYKAGVSEKFGIEGLRAVGISIYWLFSLFFLLFMILQTKNGFPWSQYIDWERNLQFPLDRELIGALGILLPFSLIGVFTALKSKSFEKIFIASWLIVPLLLIPIAPKLNLSNIRLIQGVPYLPLAILAVLGIKTIETFIITSILKTGDAKEGSQTKLHKEAKIKFAPLILGGLKRSLGNLSGRTRELILLVIISIFIIFTLPTLQWSLKDQIREFMPIYGNVYLDNRLFDSFKFINLNFPPRTTTLSTFYSGNYLPAYTNTVSFIGHFGYTYNVEKKEKDTQRFFKGKMTDEEAKNFLLSNKIALIFQGPEEKPLYKDYLYPILLKIVYDKEEATLYKPNF